MCPSRLLTRLGLAVVTVIGSAGCKSDGTGVETGEISIALNLTSAAVLQGTSLAVTATVTRSGGFTGPVQFAVTGHPTGVTAALSNEVTNGLITTATITFTVGGAVAAGTHTLVVTGTGEGVLAATANFNLTVVALASR